MISPVLVVVVMIALFVRTVKSLDVEGYVDVLNDCWLQIAVVWRLAFGGRENRKSHTLWNCGTMVRPESPKCHFLVWRMTHFFKILSEPTKHATSAKSGWVYLYRGYVERERERFRPRACTFEYQGGRYRNTGWMIYGMIVIAGNDWIRSTTSFDIANVS